MSMQTTSAAVRRPTVANRIFANASLLLGGMILFVILAVSLLVPWLMNLDPYAVAAENRLKPPSIEHWLGTDNFGRDITARLLAGATTSLFLAATVAVLSSVIGAIVGILASFFTILDNILMRICDGLMAIPAVMLAVALTASFGPSVKNLILALTVVFTPNVARLVRSRALSVKSEIFVEASQAIGAGSFYIMRRHIFPNTLSVLVVQATFIFADTIITEAALSFLGAGVPTPEPSWGNILYDGKAVIVRAPYMVVFTSLALVLTVVGLNLAGDGLRDLVEQRSRTGTATNVFSRLLASRKRKTRTGTSAT